MLETQYKVKASSGWQSYKKAHLLICFDNLITKAKLSAAIHWINSRFEFLVIDIADSVNRHYHVNISDQDAHGKTMELGNNWISQNAPIFRKITIPYEIRRWDSWLAKDKFHECRKELSRLLDTNTEFRTLVQSDIDSYHSRNRHKDYDQCVKCHNGAMR